MNLNSNFYYMLGPLFVKHMIWRRDGFTYKYLLYSHLLGNSKRQTTSGPLTKQGSWICLVYLCKLSQHLKFRRLMQRSAFQAYQRTKSGPLWSHSTVWSACRGCPFCMERVFSGLLALPGFFTYSGHQLSLHKHLNFQFLFYSLFWWLFQDFRDTKLLFACNWFTSLKEFLKYEIEFFKVEIISWSFQKKQKQLFLCMFI